MARSPISLLIDQVGNPVGVVDKEGNYRLLVETTVSGQLNIDPANTGGLALDTTLQQIDITLSGIKDSVEDPIPSGINEIGRVRLRDNHGKDAQFSAFGLLKTASESTISDFRFNSGEDLPFTISTSGSASYSYEPGGTGIKLSTGASSSSGITMSSNTIHYYQSGRGQLAKFSVILGDDGVAGNVREWGYADSDDGILFRLSDTTLSLVVRKNGSETVIDASNWDTPITHDQYGHLYYIQFEWLGVGNIYIYYDEELVHTYSFIGTSTELSIGNPDLPIWYKNENTSNTSDVYMKMGCASVCTEGGTIISGQDDDGILRQVKVDNLGNLATVQHIYTYGDGIFRRTDNSSTGMNIDGTDDNTENIWDGTGAGDTGSDWTRGGSGSETAGSAYSGTNGLDTGVRAKNDESYFDYGSDRDLPSLVDSVSFWMQPKAYPGSSNLKVGWRPDGGGGTIGNLVSVSGYVANMNLDEWKQVTIPIEDFNLDSNAGRFRLRYSGAAGQQFWFDDIQLVDDSGLGAQTFRVAAPSGERWYVEEIRLVVSAGDTGWDSDAFINIAAGIPNGLVVRHRDLSEGTNFWNIVVTDNVELFGRFDSIDTFAFGDEELLTTFKKIPKISSVIITDNDVLEIVVRDDLRSLTNMRGYIDYGVK